MEKTPKLSRNVKALSVVSLLNDASSDMVYPLIPIFLTTVLGASFTTVGIIEGIAESTASLLKIFSGWISDKLKKRKMLTVLGYSLSMFAKPMLAFARSPWHVLLVRFSDRFGKGIRQAPRDALIAESTDHRMIGHAFGFHKSMDTLGATVGPLIGVLLLYLLHNNFRSVFLLSFVASLGAVLTLLIFVREKKDRLETNSFPKLSFKLLPRRYIFFLIGLAVFAIGNSSDAFLFLRAQNVGVSASLIPLLYALSNTVFALLATQFGKMADRIAPQKIMMAGYLVFALAHFGFATIASPLTVWLLFPLIGIFSSLTESIQKTITVQTSDPQLKGTMLGLTHMTIGLCQLPASIIAGLLWEKGSASAPFFFGSITAVSASLILLFTFSLHKNQTAT